MRGLFALSLVLALPAVGMAQTCEPGVLMAGMGPMPVAVTLRAGERLKGTLICVDDDVVVLGNGTRIHTLPLDDVVRIVKPRDPLWNGILIGAAIGLWVGSTTYGEARYGGARQAPYVLSAAATFAAVGAGVDWFHSSSWTIYSAGPQPPGDAPLPAWRVRF